MDSQVTKQVADFYQDLFNLMSNEYGLILTISEMDEIIRECRKITEKINIFNFSEITEKWK